MALSVRLRSVTGAAAALGATLPCNSVTAAMSWFRSALTWLVAVHATSVWAVGENRPCSSTAIPTRPPSVGALA